MSWNGSKIRTYRQEFSYSNSTLAFRPKNTRDKSLQDEKTTQSQTQNSWRKTKSNERGSQRIQEKLNRKGKGCS